MAPATRAARRVAFEGAEYIEYDAEQPAVVRLCGAGPSGGALSTKLECEARGLGEAAIAAAGGSAERALEAQHAAEARRVLAQRGFSPLVDGLRALQTQLRAADLLLACATLIASLPEDVEADGGALDSVLPSDWWTRDASDPSLLRRAQLAKKEVEGRVDDCYAFGRRFVSAEAFVDSLERSEVLEMARERGLELPEVDEEEKAAMKIPDRGLVALRGPGAGKTLKQLTLRELVAEAQEHGIDVEGERDSGAKKSKRAWIDVLKPLVHEDMLKIRVLMREEVMLRELVASAIEREAAEAQLSRVRTLVQALVKQVQGDQPDAEPAVDASKAPGHGAAVDKQSTDSGGRLDRYFEQLVAAIQPPSE